MWKREPFGSGFVWSPTLKVFSNGLSPEMLDRDGAVDLDDLALPRRDALDLGLGDLELRDLGSRPPGICRSGLICASNRASLSQPAKTIESASTAPTRVHPHGGRSLGIRDFCSAGRSRSTWTSGEPGRAAAASKASSS
jgi:hypothetical protein